MYNSNEITFNYRTYTTGNHSRSIDASFNVLFIPNLVARKIGLIMISNYWLSFWLIQTRRIGNTERSNLLALVTLILLKSIHLVNLFTLPTIVLFIKQYSKATAPCLQLIFLQMSFSVTLPKEIVKHLLTNHVLNFLDSHDSPCLHSTNLHQWLLNHFLWPPYLLNLLGNIQRRTQIVLWWGLWILHTIVYYYDILVVRLPIVLTVIVIIQVSITVKPIFGV
jgi:hypothetical protein